MNKYRKATWLRWARLVVWFGFPDQRAAECVGLLPEDVEMFSNLHMDALEQARWEKINQESAAVVNLHYQFILANYQKPKVKPSDLVPFQKPKDPLAEHRKGIKRQQKRLAKLAADAAKNKPVES